MCVFCFFIIKKKSSFLFRVQEQHDYYWKYAEQTGLVSTHVLKMRGPCTCFLLFFFFFLQKAKSAAVIITYSTMKVSLKTPQEKYISMRNGFWKHLVLDKRFDWPRLNFFMPHWCFDCDTKSRAPFSENHSCAAGTNCAEFSRN